MKGEDVWETNPILKHLCEVTAFAMLYPTHQQYVNTHPNARLGLLERRKKRYEIWKNSNHLFPVKTKGETK